MEIAWECASLIQQFNPAWPLCIKKSGKKKKISTWLYLKVHTKIKNESCWSINQSLDDDDENRAYIGNHSKSKYRAMEDDTKRVSSQEAPPIEEHTVKEQWRMKNLHFLYSLWALMLCENENFSIIFSVGLVAV